jgi:hypothetical protein
VPDKPEGQLDQLARENARLTHEARHLQERLAALESSRWWRLHPRFLFGGARRSTNESSAPSVTGSHPLDFDETDVDLYKRVAPYTMTPPSRVYALARAIEYIAKANVPGAVVECGVWRGGSMMAAALTLLRLGVVDRELYLFDTFTGMTTPGPNDVTAAGDAAADRLSDAAPDSRLRAEASLEDVRQALLGVGYPEERIYFVAGPVEETLPAHAPTRIALLRLDTDWYSSTKHELVHLYPRLVTRGVLIVDDYGYWRGQRKAVDEYLDENDVRLLLNRVDNSARIAVKP